MRGTEGEGLSFSLTVLESQRQLKEGLSSSAIGIALLASDLKLRIQLSLKHAWDDFVDLKNPCFCFHIWRIGLILGSA